MAGGGKGGGSQTQTTTQKSEPWAEQQPYLKEIFGQAQNQYNSSNPQYYAGSTIANQSADTQNAVNMGRSAAGNSGILNTAGGVANATARGDYLDPSTNPYLASTFQAAADPVMRNFQTAVAPGIDGGRVAAGRYGSGAWTNMQQGAQTALGQTLGGLATNIYGGNYQQERDRQMGAVNNAGNTFQQGFLPAQALATIGQQQDARSQDVLNADITRFNYNQNLPAAKLAQYQQMIQGNYGGTATTQTPLYSNNSAAGLGGMLGIGSLLGGAGGGKGGGKVGNGIFP